MIIYYDDTCQLCSKTILFLKKRNAKIDFTPLSKATLPQRLKKIDSLILQKGRLYYVYADAVIYSICAIGGFYKLFWILFIVPRSIRDWTYKKIAKKRHCLIKNK